MRLHPQLPPTLMWGYDGQVPGPTIEVRRGQRVRIAWTNRIPRDSEYPVTSVELKLRRDGRPQSSTEPGRTVPGTPGAVRAVPWFRPPGQAPWPPPAPVSLTRSWLVACRGAG
ncbi:hypothetical protein GCM10010313_16710 [Streptomyces violarus]|nr:hypothetical protein GCM10010313_16710 [Streptomyces violarus]